MSCATCEKVRRFFRNGVEKIAPFTEITDMAGGVIVVANINGQIVGATEGLRYMLGGTARLGDTYVVVKFGPNGMGFAIQSSKSGFVNHYK